MSHIAQLGPVCGVISGVSRGGVQPQVVYEAAQGRQSPTPMAGGKVLHKDIESHVWILRWRYVHKTIRTVLPRLCGMCVCVMGELLLHLLEEGVGLLHKFTQK